jgi:nucleotide-binding universal stress UspA family protein
MSESSENELRLFLPLEPDDDLKEISRLIPALFPPAVTRLRRLFVCRPIQLDLYMPEMYYSLPEVAQLNLEAQLAAAHQSREAIMPLVERGYRAESDVVQGQPIAEILRDIAAWRSDVAVIRTRRRGSGADRLGNLTSALLHKAPCPVLTFDHVPEDYKIRRILIATDFSEASRKAADWGMVLADAANAEAHLLYVMARHANRTRISEDKLAQAGAEEIARWRKSISPDFPRLSTDAHVQRAETPAEGILQFAREEEFDLIVIAGTGRSALAAVLLGSNAQTVIRLSPVPVFVLPSESRVNPESLREKLAAGSVTAER